VRAFSASTTIPINNLMERELERMERELERLGPSRVNTLNK